MSMINQAFVLCAGKGTRMAPATHDTPKCLLDMAGEPVISRIIAWLSKYDVNDLIVNLYYQFEKVIDYFSEIKTSGSIQCSIEDQLLGTAGGIRNCYHDLEDRFVIVYGDIITNVNLSQMMEEHDSNERDVTVLSLKSDNPSACGVIVSDEINRIIELHEKPNDPTLGNVVNGGVMICKKTIFENVPYGKAFDICKDLFPILLKKELKLYHRPLRDDEWLFDMGTWENYHKCVEKLKNVNV